MSSERSRRWWRVALVCATLLTSQQSPLAALQILDNSFLLEEAYNQEAGVVQHISSFSHSSPEQWIFSFTQEWPLGGIRHQLSYTIPVQHLSPAGTGLGDLGLNYRYQLVGSSETRTALAPRVTLLFPTGREPAGRGSGGFGLQANIPLSLVLSPSFTTHWNIGATLVPRATHAGGAATTLSQNLGASLVWSLRPSFNLLIESVWIGGETAVGQGTTSREQVTLLSPGFRAAFDFPGGLQVVPGLAYTVGLGRDSAEDSIFLYLSLEHPFKPQ
jgi:Putative MetA-pathway of phenol degradation